MQTENTEAVLDHGYLVSCVLPSLPLPSACRGYGLPAGLVRDWKGKKSYAGRALDSLSLLLLPAYERVGKLLLSQKREVHGSPLPWELQPEWQLPAWCPWDLWGRYTVQVTYISCCLLWPCCWDSWVPLGDQCGGPARALGARAWPSWCEQSGIPSSVTALLKCCLPLEKILGCCAWDPPSVGASTHDMQLPWHSSKPGSRP